MASQTVAQHNGIIESLTEQLSTEKAHLQSYKTVAAKQLEDYQAEIQQLSSTVQLSETAYSQLVEQSSRDKSEAEACDIKLRLETLQIECETAVLSLRLSESNAVKLVEKCEQCNAEVIGVRHQLSISESRQAVLVERVQHNSIASVEMISQMTELQLRLTLCEAENTTLNASKDNRAVTDRYAHWLHCFARG